MSASRGAEFVIVGSGVSGILAASELVRAGREVLVLERGGLLPHARGVETDSHELQIPSTRHNHETAPGSRPYPWEYVYGVGGTSLRWAGVTPRLLPSDFELRSRFGVGRDWPIAYDELAPFYLEAERALGVAGARNPFFPGTDRFPQPPHPFAPADRLVRSQLRPYFRLPQARPTRAINGRPACCASARCNLCPVDARYSVLHTIHDQNLIGKPGFALRDRTIAARLRVRGDEVASVECLDERGEPLTIRARRVVVAANGIENPAILLRSGLGGPDVGRWLFDHAHRLFEIELDRKVGAGRGTTIETGISYAYADGEFRARRGSMIVFPFNPGTSVAQDLIQGLAAGRSGTKLRDEIRRRFEHTLVLDAIGEDLPQANRFVELSPRRDSFGLPLNRITYPEDSPYLERSRSHLDVDLPRRLRRYGVGSVRAMTAPPGAGSHLLGTCYMGESEGVVDGSLRHHRIRNLYVAGGSCFPSYSAHHPTLTIAALGIRLGRHLASEAD